MLVNIKNDDHFTDLAQGKKTFALLSSPESDYWLPVQQSDVPELIRAAATFGHTVVGDIQTDRVTIWVSESPVGE